MIATASHSQPATARDSFSRLAGLIPSRHRLKYSNIDTVTGAIKKIDNSQQNGGAYVLIEQIHTDHVQAVSEGLCKISIRGHARFTHKNVVEGLIIRLMPPGLGHEVVSREFMLMISDRVAAMPGWTFAAVSSASGSYPFFSSWCPVEGSR
ncbi:hypothetical protein DFH27DRAFT_574236 [Peziza echinospora]|nr:hypothetical protein DFH27DRAFT_574236 [Peziza echinospora]